MQTMAIVAEMMSPFPKSGREKNAFPTICQFLSEHASSGQLEAKIDVVQFFGDRQPKFERNLTNKDLANQPTPTARDGTAQLFIIEAIDPITVQYFLSNRVGVNRTSFLKFLEDFLDCYPSYNFDDMENHFPPRQSTTARQQHVCFQVMSIREFDQPLEIDRGGLYDAVKATWKDVRLHGLLKPAGRKYRRATPDFPPCVLSRNHFAAWFDGKAGQGWQTGVILVDRILKLDKIKIELKPPAYGKLAGEDTLLGPPDTQSYRRALSFYMEHNQDIMSRGLPTPFIALQDMYRIISSEWIILSTYIVRDLNDIGWTLLKAKSELRSKGKFDDTLDVLFSTQWRLSWILQLAKKPLKSCRERGHTSWGAISPMHGRNPTNETALSTALVEDFEQVLSELSLSKTRVAQNISHAMALTAVVQTGRAVMQNNVLMVLSLVAILFLPANLLAAIFNMQGDWAPGTHNFGLFCIISVSTSALLFILFMILWFWTSISSSMELVSKHVATRKEDLRRLRATDIGMEI